MLHHDHAHSSPRFPLNPPSPLPLACDRYKDGMGPEELCDVAARCLLAAMARDCLSGVDAVVHVITREGGLTTRVLKCPSD